MPSPDPPAPFAGKNNQNVIDCNRKLDELSIKSTVNLPQLVAFGDQSTGKSSLIAALSGVHVPRSERRCTQCPIEINIIGTVSSDTSWQCNVSVGQNYRYDKSRDLVPTQQNPFGRWQVLDPSECKTFNFATTTSADELGLLIKAAQCAILNPGNDIQDYVPRDDIPIDESTNVNFSPNPVRLDIWKYGWPSLSFTDLPGVFASAQNPKDKPYKCLVDNLVSKYAENPATVILLTLPMSSDLVNSKSRDLLHDIPGAAERTLAVLTKPDCALPKNLNQYVDLLLEASEDNEFKLGYYVVRMSDPDVSQDEARRVEAGFFALGRWADLVGDPRARLGVEALRAFLQKILFEKTQAALPDSLEPLHARIASINDRLQEIFPAPPRDDLFYILRGICAGFQGVMEQKFYGTGHGGSMTNLIEQWCEHATSFQNAVRDQSPTFVLRSSSDGTKGGSSDSPMEIDDDEPFIHNLDDIQRIIGVTKHEPAIIQMMRKSVGGWNMPLRKLMEHTSRLIKINTLEALHEVLQSYKHFRLHASAIAFMRDHLDQLVEREFARADMTLNDEQALPWTVDDDGFEAKRQVALEEIYKGADCYSSQETPG